MKPAVPFEKALQEPEKHHVVFPSHSPKIDPAYHDNALIRGSSQETFVEHPPVFSAQQSGRLVIDESLLEKLLVGQEAPERNFVARRLNFLLCKYSKDVRNGHVALEALNRLATFCLEIVPLIEQKAVVMPTTTEMDIFFDWYITRHALNPQAYAQVISTVCPDYPFDVIGENAVYTQGELGDGIGLIGESILNKGSCLLQIISHSLRIPLVWVVGYAGFEAKQENLDKMNISAEEFRKKLEISASRLEQELGIPVGILPDIVGLTYEQFDGIKERYRRDDFYIERQGMDALSEAVDARDWAGIFSIANALDAIIVDGASVFMGRKAYRKTEQMLQSPYYTPRFYCMSNYVGFAS